MAPVLSFLAAPILDLGISPGLYDRFDPIRTDVIGKHRIEFSVFGPADKNVSGIGVKRCSPILFIEHGQPWVFMTHKSEVCVCSPPMVLERGARPPVPPRHWLSASAVVVFSFFERDTFRIRVLLRDMSLSRRQVLKRYAFCVFPPLMTSSSIPNWNWMKNFRQSFRGFVFWEYHFT